MKSRKKHDSSKDISVFRPWLCTTLERIEAQCPDTALITWHARDFIPSRSRRKILILARKFAGYLASLGISAGNAVAVDAPMRWEIPVIWTAVQMIGAAPIFLPADLRHGDAARDLHKLDADNAKKTPIIVSDPESAKQWLDENDSRSIIFLDEAQAESVLGLPLPENACSFAHAIEHSDPYLSTIRVSDESTAAITYSQGSRRHARQIKLSYALIASQAEEIAASLQLSDADRIFFDMTSIQTVSLSVLAACMFAGAGIICRHRDVDIFESISASHPTIIFIRPHELAEILENVKNPVNASRLTQKWRSTCLKFGKFRERNTRKWLSWSAPVIDTACLRPVRRKYFPDVRSIISYGNHFKTKSAETLSFLDIPIKNAFTTAEIGIIHIHDFKGTGSFLKSVESKIKNGLLSVRRKRASAPFIHTGDLVFEDERSGLCSRRNVTVRLSTDETVDTSPMRQILKRNSIIDEVFIFGENRPFLSALIYLDPDRLRAFALEQKIADTDFRALAQNPVVYAHIRAIVDACNLTRKPIESIQKIAILPTPLDDDPRILTPCRLARLGEIQRRYKGILSSFYHENF